MRCLNHLWLRVTFLVCIVMLAHSTIVRVGNIAACILDEPLDLQVLGGGFAHAVDHVVWLYAGSADLLLDFVGGHISYASYCFFPEQGPLDQVLARPIPQLLLTFLGRHMAEHAIMVGAHTAKLSIELCLRYFLVVNEQRHSVFLHFEAISAHILHLPRARGNHLMQAVPKGLPPSAAASSSKCQACIPR